MLSLKYIFDNDKIITSVGHFYCVQNCPSHFVFEMTMSIFMYLNDCKLEFISHSPIIEYIFWNICYKLRTGTRDTHTDTSRTSREIMHTHILSIQAHTQSNTHRYKAHTHTYITCTQTYYELKQILWAYTDTTPKYTHSHTDTTIHTYYIHTCIKISHRNTDTVTGTDDKHQDVQIQGIQTFQKLGKQHCTNYI